MLKVNWEESIISRTHVHPPPCSSNVVAKFWKIPKQLLFSQNIHQVVANYSPCSPVSPNVSQLLATVRQILDKNLKLASSWGIFYN